MRHRLGQLGARDGRVAEWVLPGAVDRIRTEHLRGRRDHAMLLWRLLALEGWLGALARGDLERPNRGSAEVGAIIDGARESA
jgi:hypothetical protein